MLEYSLALLAIKYHKYLEIWRGITQRQLTLSSLDHQHISKFRWKM